MTKSEVFHQAFGYELNAIKPVHLVNGFLLAITGGHYRLEWLNKLSVINHKKGLIGDYESEKLRDILQGEKASLSPEIDLTALNYLRQQANAIVANDDAVYAAFDSYSAFGNDYTISSPDFLCDLKRKDGYAGYLIYSVLNESETGRQILSITKTEFERRGDSLASLFGPVLDRSDSRLEWDNRYEEKLGVLDKDRLSSVATTMTGATNSLHRLLIASRQLEARYSFLRHLGIGLSIWLLRYLIKEASSAAGLSDSPLLFCDFTGRRSKKCRDRSIHCYSRHRELVYRSFPNWLESGRIDTLDPFKDNSGRLVFKDIERHFQDLAVRAGIAQPRATTTRAKHYQLLPDTIRTITLSLIGSENGPITFQDFAVRLREVWGIVLGACDDDVKQLASQGIVGLDEDDDLNLNRRCFIDQLKVLGLAVEPSDGLVLCEVDMDRGV